MGTTKPRRSAKPIPRPFRSHFEANIASDLKGSGVDFDFERLKIKFTHPARQATYTPDFVLKKNGIIIEAKGQFDSADRKKHLLIREQFPEYDIRFVFYNAKTKIGKASSTTYADWCDRKGFLWAEKKVPQEWLDEPPKSTTQATS